MAGKKYRRKVNVIGGTWEDARSDFNILNIITNCHLLNKLFRTCSTLFALICSTQKLYGIALLNEFSTATLGIDYSGYADGFPFVNRDRFINESFPHILFAVMKWKHHMLLLNLRKIDAHSLFLH
ncbi:hypothetical protein DINM_006510 [Dirofilaria immitis]|nr:hypothetical protein [Dirofilaria immitis]